MTASPPARSKRPWWQWVLGGFVGLLILGAIFGNDDSENAATETKTVAVTESAPATQTATEAEPAETVADAREAVDDDDYSRAVAIAAAIGAAEEDAIRRRIADRLARRALAEVRSGDRSQASSLLRQAGSYPRTQQLTQARAGYRAAKERAAESARARRIAAEQRAAQREREAEAAEQAEAGGGSGCDPNYSGCVPAYPPDVNCPEVDGPVSVTGSDPHGLDRDGDSVACE